MPEKMVETKTTIKLGFLAVLLPVLLTAFLPQALAQTSQDTGKPTIMNAEVNASKGFFGGGLVPCGNTAADRCTLANLFQLIYRVIQFLMACAALFAVFQILRQGFNMLLSLGSEEKTTAAKKGLVNALWGLLLILISYVLMLAILGVFGLIDLKKGFNPLNDPIKFIESNNPNSN